MNNTEKSCSERDSVTEKERTEEMLPPELTSISAFRDTILTLCKYIIACTKQTEEASGTVLISHLKNVKQI